MTKTKTNYGAKQPPLQAGGSRMTPKIPCYHMQTSNPLRRLNTAMTSEEMEKTMAFILEQQAQFAINQQRHEEIMHRHEEAMLRIEASQELTAQQGTHLSTAMVELAEGHTRTAEAQSRTEAALAETN